MVKIPICKVALVHFVVFRFVCGGDPLMGEYYMFSVVDNVYLRMYANQL